jgi:hypothetical protein
MGLMLRDVVRAGPSDHRYVGKGIGARAILLVPAVNLAAPLLWARNRRVPYPFWMDDLLLSIVALDLAGNVLDLYDRHTHFDLIPHAHGTGALTVLTAWLLGAPLGRAARLATAGHILLEGQEIASDVVFGYRNVRGWWDSAGDIAAGVVGTAVYGALYDRFVRRAGREPPSLIGDR